MYKLSVLEQARRVIEIEMDALQMLKDSFDEKFEDAVEIISRVKGKVFLSGVGKSGLIARKIAATMSSTGTPTVFLHPTECFHGDIGVVSKDDVGILLSFSGETEELLQTIPIFKRMGIIVISMTGKKDSILAKHSDQVLHVPIEQEACPMGIVPTASTTAMLAMGDAIAVSLLIKKGFTEKDFAALHPGGSLGRRLLIRVKDIMHKLPSVPLVKDNVTMREALIQITSKSLGITGVVDSNGVLIGSVTDGDLRRHMEKSSSFLDDCVSDVMTRDPKTICSNELAVNALNEMEDFKITHLFVVDKKSEPGKNLVGLLHIHNILGAKII